MSIAKFPLGLIVITPGIAELMNKDQQNRACLDWFLARHQSGDWGDVDPEDKRENDLSVTDGFRILSVYYLLDQKLWVITEADRRSTTVLLPSEY
jgi:hypothetical protein